MCAWRVSVLHEIERPSGESGGGSAARRILVWERGTGRGGRAPAILFDT